MFSSLLRQTDPKTEENPKDESVRLGFRPVLRRSAWVILGGLMYAAALPPWNISVLGVFALVPPILVAAGRRPGAAAFYSFIWALAWALPSYWFLREISPAVPFLLAPVLALWPMVWGASASCLIRLLMVPAEARANGANAVAEAEKTVPAWKIFAVAAALAAWWIVLEFSRSTMFPWNNLSTTMWQNGRFLFLASYAGQYAIGFFLAFFSAALALGIRYRRADGRIRALPALVILFAFWGLGMAASWQRNRDLAGREVIELPVAAVQGDISQRRNADESEAAEALDIYLELTRKTEFSPRPALIVWPETAVPYAFKGGHPVSEKYRRGVRELLAERNIPMLIGSIDFRLLPKGAASNYGITNSALLLAPGPVETGRYDKTHRVPYGEYIPFRSFLPGFFIRAIDMNRDLFPGSDYAPLNVAPGVRAGISICFESVFAYIAREEARRGANMLLVISNDAWYPTSSEPEQHLANALLRSVETGLPSLRCGNNGGTLVVSPLGKIASVLETPGGGLKHLRRGRAAGVLTVEVPKAPAMTFYTRHGEWLIVLLSIIVFAAFALALSSWAAEKKQIIREN